MIGARLVWRVVSSTTPPRVPVCRRRSPTTTNQQCWQSTSQGSSSTASAQDPFPLPESQRATPYDIFHLPRTSSASEIKARYYELVKIYHPDRALSKKIDDDVNKEALTSTESSFAAAAEAADKAHEDFKRVREAYSLLSNVRMRRLYDRSGIGWDPGRGRSNLDTSGAPVWNGGFPRTPEEMAAYEAWSSSFKRGAPGSMNRAGWEFRGRGRGHDGYGWQAYAGNSANVGSEWFYGYGHSRHHANSGREPMYTTNSRFMITLTFLTTILALGQYIRLREESKMVVGLADRRHQSAAKSLDEARNFARSDVGRARIEEIRKRARERAMLEDNDTASNEWTSIGRGGPSGREAYEARMRRIGWSTEDI